MTCQKYPVVVPVNGKISCKDFDTNFQVLKAFVDAFCDLDQILLDIEANAQLAVNAAQDAQNSASAANQSLVDAQLVLAQVQALQSQLQPLVTNLTALLNLEGNLTEVLNVEANLAELLALEAALNELNALFLSLTQLLNLEGSLTQLLNVEGSLTEILNVEANLTEILAVFGSLANINIVATNIADVNTVATNIQAVIDSLQNALDAQAAAAQAIAAANSILANIDFTGAANGDILLHNGTLFEPVEHREALRSKVPFERSLVGANSYINRAFAWDSFQRPNTTISQGLGVADSGQTWQQLGSIPRMFIQNKSAGRNTSSFGFEVIERTTFGATPSSIGDGNLGCKLFGFDASGGTYGIGVVFAKDDLNYITAVKNGSAFVINKTVAGVESQLQTTTISGPVNMAGFWMEAIFIRNVFNSTVSVQINSNVLSTKAGIVISGEWNIFGQNLDDIKYVGIVSGSAINLRPIFSFLAYNLF
jgi:chorismate-pyruvate lyase